MALALIAVDFTKRVWFVCFGCTGLSQCHERRKKAIYVICQGHNLRCKQEQRLLINNKRWSLPFPWNHHAGLSDGGLSRYLRRGALRCLIKMVIQWLAGLQEILPLASLPVFYCCFYTDANRRKLLSLLWIYQFNWLRRWKAKLPTKFSRPLIGR